MGRYSLDSPDGIGFPTDDAQSKRDPSIGTSSTVYAELGNSLNSGKWIDEHSLEYEMRLRHHHLPVSPVDRGVAAISSISPRASSFSDSWRLYDSGDTASIRNLESVPREAARQRRRGSGCLSRRWCIGCSACAIFWLLILGVLLPVLFIVVIPNFVKENFRTLGTNTEGTIQLERLSVTSINDNGLVLDIKADIGGQAKSFFGKYAEITPAAYRLVGDRDGKQYMVMNVKESIHLDSSGTLHLDIRGMDLTFPGNGEAFRQHIDNIFRSSYVPHTDLKVTSDMVVILYGFKLASIPVERPISIAHKDLRPLLEGLVAKLKEMGTNFSGDLVTAGQEALPTGGERQLFTPHVRMADMTDAVDRIKDMVKPKELFANLLFDGENSTNEQSNAGDGVLVKLADVTIDMDFTAGSMLVASFPPIHLELASASGDISVEGIHFCKIIAHPIRFIRGKSTVEFQIDMFVRQQDIIGMLPVAARLILGGDNQTATVSVRGLTVTDKDGKTPAWAVGILSAMVLDLPVPVPKIQSFDGDLLGKLLDSMKRKFEELKEKLKEKLKQKALELKDRLKQKALELKDRVKQKALELKDRVKEKIREKASDLKNKVSDKFRKLKHKTVDKVADAKNRFVSKVKSAASKVKNKVKPKGRLKR